MTYLCCQGLSRSLPGELKSKPASVSCFKRDSITCEEFLAKTDIKLISKAVTELTQKKSRMQGAHVRRLLGLLAYCQRYLNQIGKITQSLYDS